LEVARALDKAMMALWDIDGLCTLLREHGAIGEASFPDEVASAIRMIEHRVSVTVKEIENVP